MPHQVLVYSGPGVSPVSLSHTILTLTLLLSPHYTVQPAPPDLLRNQPWETACALLVVPGGRDLPYVEEMSARSGLAKRIKTWVNGGGRYLGICAGAYFGAKTVRFDVGGAKQVVGERELAFWDGSCEGPSFPGFEYASEAGARIVELNGTRVYYNGGGHFVGEGEVLARYNDGRAAVVKAGRAILCSVHPEYPLNEPPASDLGGGDDEARLDFVRGLLEQLGLDPPAKAQADLLHPTHPSPIFVYSDVDIFASLRSKIVDGVLRDGNDEFHFIDPPDLDQHRRTVTPLDAPKLIVTAPPELPLFNYSTYRSEASSRIPLLYGETVTSTQTMLDRNPLLLANLPTPLVFMASFQLSGRGRGNNVWLSPAGCLQFSLLLSLPSKMSSKLVFVQYLAALAICEAVDPSGKLGVRIKWPNDVYTADGRKLGGILVNTNLVNGEWRVIVGCGVNVLNALPTTSLSQLHQELMARRPESTDVAPTMEGTFAKIMDSFTDHWVQFQERGFEPFFDSYYGRWLHS